MITDYTVKMHWRKVMNTLEKKDLKASPVTTVHGTIVPCFNLSEQTTQYQFYPAFPGRILAIQKHS